MRIADCIRIAFREMYLPEFGQRWNARMVDRCDSDFPHEFDIR